MVGTGCRTAVVMLLGAIILTGYGVTLPAAGTVLARRAGRAGASFPAAGADDVRDMDQRGTGPIALTADEVKGR